MVASFDISKPDLDYSPNSDDILIANIKMFLFAGHDTLSLMVCFMAKLLQDNPKCLAKLRREHDDVFGSDLDRAAHILTTLPYLLSSLLNTLGFIKERI